MDSHPSQTFSRGAASCLVELAMIARQDPAAIQKFVIENLPIWEALDRETLHPVDRDQKNA